MNIQEYIASGILEAYILGALSTEEHSEVVANIAMYPEVAAEVAAIEKAMLQYAELNAKEPPAHIQEQIWQALSKKPAETTRADKAPQVISMASRTHEPQWQRAAILIALVGSVLTNFFLWNQKTQSEQQVAYLTSHSDTMQQKLQNTALNLQKVKDMMADTSMQTIVMQSMVKDRPMAATVYWSRQKGDTYLMVDKMPMPPKGMQYQMWAIKDGKPVSMGMISNDFIASADGMNKLSMQIVNGQAFAISLEKEGGNPTPTQVCVLGKVASI